MSSSGLHLDDFRIPLEEIILATENFSLETLIGMGGFSRVYKGKFSAHLQNRTTSIKRHIRDSYDGKNEFLSQLKLLITLKHENIIPFIGYCDEGDEMITVIEYAINGSLDHHLKNTSKRRQLTWVQRLKICIGVARGLNYLHTGLGEDKVVIHRIINSGCILLDENLEAKISGFSLLKSVPRDQPRVYETSAAGIWHYMDPIYHESGILKADADVYSFGIVLFEILTGMLAGETKETDDAKPQHMINLVRRYYDDGLDKLIDPFIRDQIVRRSLLTFEEMAYKCISFKTKDRPTMEKIIKTLEEALNIQNRRTASAITIRTNQYQNLQNFIIPLEKIKSATYNFSSEFLIKDGSTKVYRGEIFVGFQLHVVSFKRYDPNGGQENEEFRNELEVISRSQHENIIPFIGFCDEGGEMIIINEYAVNGSLKRHLQDPDRRRCITWAQRLKICIGAATGLNYLHSGPGYERDKVIHRNFKRGNILLGQNLKSKISGFGMSILVPKDQRQVFEPVEGTHFYIDPFYQECGILQTESDTYSFGMVLFEILSGMLAYHKRSIGVEQPQNLRNLVRRYYDDGPENLIDPLIRDQIDDRSFRLFTEIAYKCMSFNMEDRPSMNRVIKRIKEALDIQNQRDASTFNRRSIQPQKQEDFRIPLEEIKKAIQKFGERIGSGGFGTVYKGQLSERWNNRIAAIKCLDLNSKQGKNEFYNELNLISRFHHENIVTFIGYCDEDEEMIFVYEYAINGSLDSHLEHPKKDRPITWAERLKICIGAARGLKYLHLGGEDNNTVIHRDVKSGNILLDENFEAKICDFGFSKSGPDDQPHSKFYTKAAGTRYYIDPSYQESGILRKESDVYSFGVVMFELLTGIPAWHQRSFGDGNRQILINLVRRYYDNGLDELIDPRLKHQIDKRSSHKFTEIAYECINLTIEKRPTMDRIIDRIEDALELQHVPFASEAYEHTTTRHQHKTDYFHSLSRLITLYSLNIGL